MKAIAIITARGGSKRIPRKNIKEFCGKPIIQYSIEAALNSGVFDEVMVSTEDEEIKAIAERCGAKVPFMRSQDTAGDMVMTHEVVLEVLDCYRKLGRKFDYACCIYPTAPFITAERLRKSCHKLVATGADGIIPVMEFSFPPQRALIMKNEMLQFKWPENRLVRSQDLEKFYHDCGQYYFVNVERFLQTKNLLMESTIPEVVSEMEAQDIDTLNDWEVAEFKYRLMRSKKNEIER